MTQDELIGTWTCTLTGSIHELRPDGTCVIRTTAPNGKTYEDRAEWQYHDGAHWTLRLFIEPDPDIPELEDGGVEVIDYEVVAEGPGRMSLRQFDVDLPWQWEKATRPTR
jgi:hypothetical protein